MALRRNQTAIPIPPQRVPGVLLPPDEYCLLKENYQVVSSQANAQASSSSNFFLYFRPNLLQLDDIVFI